MTLAAFTAFALLSLFAAISPGPAVLMSARTGLTEGFRTGAMLAAGIGAGAVVWAAAAMFGLNLLFAAAPALLWALKIGGGAYLIWMGIKLWREATEPFDTTDTRPVPRSGALGLPPRPVHPACQPQTRRDVLRDLPRHRPARHRPLGSTRALLAVVFLNEDDLEHPRRPHLLARPHPVRLHQPENHHRPQLRRPPRPLGRQDRPAMTCPLIICS